jgi:4-amino-4-deoxy-L-arabinose transferase-like glycosyltransferase
MTIMPDETTGAGAKQLADVSQRRYLVFLLLFGLFALLFTLGGRCLENKDSVRFAEISREILEFNDWTLLRLGGSIYPDKPPLHFWITAGLYKLFGINVLVARLAEALAAFAGLWITYFFGRKIFRSPQTAFLAAMMLLSTYGYFFWGRRSRIDIELAVFFSLSLVCFYCGLDAVLKRNKLLWYAGFWLATGAAVMSKGPVALISLAIVIGYGLVVALGADERKITPALLAATSPLVLLPVLPWVLSLWQHPRFSEFLQVYHQTVIMNRNKPFFTYFFDFPVKLFPVSPFFFLALWGAVRFRRQLASYRGLFFTFGWVGIYLAILHLTSGKTARYLLPLYMPVALAGAWAVMFYLEKYPRIFGRIMQRTDQFFFWIAVSSLIIPFGFAYHAQISLLCALPYAVVLALVLMVVRKWLPLKAAGVFVSFIMLLLAIEAGDSIISHKTADYLQLSQVLKAHRLPPEQIRFYTCRSESRAAWAVSFYYNHVIGCSDSFCRLTADPAVQGIVTTRAAVEAENRISWQQVRQKFRIVSCDSRFVILLKPDFKKPIE